MIETIAISKICTDRGCNHTAVAARKISNFWISMCADHIGKSISIDFRKTSVPKGERRKRKTFGQWHRISAGVR